MLGNAQFIKKLNSWLKFSKLKETFLNLVRTKQNVLERIHETSAAK